MAVDFEAPVAALFARLAAIPGIQYATRELQSWDDTPPAATPSLMLTSGDITQFDAPSTLPGQSPGLFRMNEVAVLYVIQRDPAVPPSITLNGLLSAVCNAVLVTADGAPVPGRAFLPNPPGARGTTLGGLCQYCRVAGNIVIAEGLIGHEAAARIPFELVVSA